MTKSKRRRDGHGTAFSGMSRSLKADPPLDPRKTYTFFFHGDVNKSSVHSLSQRLQQVGSRVSVFLNYAVDASISHNSLKSTRASA